MRYVATIVCGMLAVLSASSAHAENVLFWNDSQGIHRLSDEGGVPQDVSPSFDALGLAADGARQHLYWTETLPTVPIGGAGRIRRAGWDGTGMTEPLIGLLHPGALALDLSVERMYWTDLESHSIHSASLDGSRARQIAQEHYWAAMRGLALDPAADKLYFSFNNPLLDNLFPSFIGRVSTDGSDFEIVVGGLGAPLGVALDRDREYLYWVDAAGLGGPKIQRVLLNGMSEAENVVTGLIAPYGIALDPAADMLYWTDAGEPTGSGKIQRRAIAGGSIIDVITGLKDPAALALYTPSPMPGDANGDGVVDRADLAILAAHYGTTTGAQFADGDFDSDGAVSLVDVAILQSHYQGGVTTTAAPVPEPAAWQIGLAAMALSTIAAARIKQRRFEISSQRLKAHF